MERVLSDPGRKPRDLLALHKRWKATVAYRLVSSWLVGRSFAMVAYGTARLLLRSSRKRGTVLMVCGHFNGKGDSAPARRCWRNSSATSTDHISADADKLGRKLASANVGPLGCFGRKLAHCYKGSRESSSPR